MPEPSTVPHTLLKKCSNSLPNTSFGNKYQKQLKSMKKIIFLLILIVSIACAEKKSTSTEQIIAYHEGFKNSDYNQIKRTLSDSLITIEGDFTTPVGASVALVRHKRKQQQNK